MIRTVLVFCILAALAERSCGIEPRERSQQVLALWSDAAPAGTETTADSPLAKLCLVEESSTKARPLLVICPGGGYGTLAADHEGDQIAQWANDIGMSALICYYRHRGQGVGHPVPLHDAQRAIRLARSKAAAWRIDPRKIGILGFSAGGHLASTVLTHFDSGESNSSDPVAREGSRPDFGILCYPVIGFGKPYTHEGSQRNLLGDRPDPQLIQALSNEDHVTAETPPTFLWHTCEDEGVVPLNSVMFYAAMMKSKVPGELHVFEKGEHGVGLARETPGTKEWPNLCETWLKVRGIL